MRRLLPLSLALALLATAARAQSDARIELYSDDLSSPCSLVDTRPGPRSIFIYQTGTVVAAASEFSVPLPSCWTGASYVGEAINPSLLAIGNTQTDLSVAYGGCRVPPVYIGRVDFFASGIAPACCVFRAQPSPSGMLVVDCAFETHAIVAGPGVTINPDETCPCNVAPPPPPPPPPPPVPLPSRIEIFADADMSECAIVDDGPGIRSVYVFHTGNASATASEFSVPLPACWTGASWVGDNVVPGFLTIGTSQTDLSIAYAGCVDLPVFIARIDFSVTGKAPPCCRVLVAPPPTQSPQEIVEVRCDYQTHAVGTGLGVTVNPPTSCACDSPTTLRTEPATWGRVKAIFRNR